MYRSQNARIEVLLVHPGGPFWRDKDLGSWSIPKGLVEPGEDPLEAAKREFTEETGFAAEGMFIPLSPVKVRSGKSIRAWAVEGNCNPDHFRSNTFVIEWPAHSGKTREFPEVDKAGWFSVDEAREKINTGQKPILDELFSRLFQGSDGESPL